jgi:hypothetical protein
MKRYLILALLVVGLAAPFGQAQAQAATPTPTPKPSATPTPVRRVFLYSVKFLCGLEPAPTNLKPPQEPPVKPGNYATAINVHNFGLTTQCMAKKVTVAFPEFQPTQLISQFRVVKLPPDGSFEIDCTDIASFFPGGLPSFVEGFVEIQSSAQLNVQAAYTSCLPSSTAAGCASLGGLEVVPEPFFSAISTTGLCF